MRALVGKREGISGGFGGKRGEHVGWGGSRGAVGENCEVGGEEEELDFGVGRGLPSGGGLGVGGGMAGDEDDGVVVFQGDARFGGSGLEDGGHGFELLGGGDAGGGLEVHAEELVGGKIDVHGDEGVTEDVGGAGEIDAGEVVFKLDRKSVV